MHDLSGCVTRITREPNIVAPECSNLTTFIGRNSAGKTSVFEALKYIQKIHRHFNDKALTEIVHGGVEKYNELFY
jgi:recombinational DNA repair ATPase RecF